MMRQGSHSVTPADGINCHFLHGLFLFDKGQGLPARARCNLCRDHLDNRSCRKKGLRLGLPLGSP